MTTGLLLAIGASFGWGALDALRKRLAEAVEPVPLAAALTLGPLPLLALWASLEGATVPDAGYVTPGLLALVVNVLANVGFVAALRLSPLGLTVPMLSLTPAFSTLGAFLVLGERPGPLQLVGLALVVVTAFVLPAAGAGAPIGVRALREEPGVPLMALVACFWALLLVIDKWALAHATVPVHLLLQNGGVGALLVSWLAARGRLGRVLVIRERLGAWLAAILVLTAAMGLQLLAVQVLLVGLVDALKRAIGLLLAVVNGRLFFDERIRGAQVAVLLVMAVGVALLVV